MNEVKIQIPDGYRISVEQSDFQEGTIAFEKDPLGSLISFPIPNLYCKFPRIETRASGPYAGRALYLDGRFDWEIVEEDDMSGRVLLARLKEEGK